MKSEVPIGIAYIAGFINANFEVSHQKLYLHGEMPLRNMYLEGKSLTWPDDLGFQMSHFQVICLFKVWKIAWNLAAHLETLAGRLFAPFRPSACWQVFFFTRISSNNCPTFLCQCGIISPGPPDKSVYLPPLESVQYNLKWWSRLICELLWQTNISQVKTARKNGQINNSSKLEC